eukprot:s876_g25.t1
MLFCWGPNGPNGTLTFASNTFMVLLGLDRTTTFVLEEKPLSDQRTYQFSTLQNGLEVLNIEDPQSHKWAMAMAVRAGSYDDPRELPGLAHFCEHMLFLGTQKYPEPSGFDQFMTKYGGSNNAFTASEATVYFAAASSEAAPEAALESFAGTRSVEVPILGAAVLGRLPKEVATSLAEQVIQQSTLSPETLEVSQRLESLLSIKKLCHSGKTSGSATSKDCKSMDVEVETLLQVAGAQMWLCHVKDGIDAWLYKGTLQSNPIVFFLGAFSWHKPVQIAQDIGCSTVLVEGVTVTEVVEALHNPEERLRWDGGNFRTFEVISAVNEPVQQDIIYCVMPAPGMLTDRDVSLDDGGQAILLQSRRPETSQRIRAFTHVSGYLICVTSDGRVEITAVSQTNLGGSIPAWVQRSWKAIAKQCGNNTQIKGMRCGPFSRGDGDAKGKKGDHTAGTRLTGAHMPTGAVANVLTGPREYRSVAWRAVKRKRLRDGLAAVLLRRQGAMADQRAAVTRCISDIEVADLVALDLEFSGLFLDTKLQRSALTFADYFAKCAESVPKFLALQLGLCCVQFRRDTATWELRTHQFDLWPQERRIFTDFNVFLEKACPYKRMKLDTKSSTGGSPTATHILAALRKAQVPLVVHNGLFDLLHLYDKFIADVPQDIQDFGKAWLEQFPLTFDTRFVAQEGRGLNLDALRSQLRGQSNLKVQRCDESNAPGSTHSGGYDATVTAEVFLLELDIWIRFQQRKKHERQEKQASTAENPQKAENAKTPEDGENATGGDEEKVKKAEKAENEGNEVVVSQESGAENGQKEAKQNSGDTQENCSVEEEEGWSVVGQRGRKRKRGAEETPEEKGLTCPSLLESHKICRRFHNKIALEFVKKEVQAINSEHQKNVQSNVRRIFELLEQQAKPESVVGRFATGNMETLYEIPSRNGTSPVDALKVYFKNRYCPEQMRLVTFGPQKLSEQLELVSKAGFQDLPKGVKACAESKRRFEEPNPFPASQMGRSLLLKGTEAIGSLWLHFPMPPLNREFKAQPLSYLNYVMNYGGENSLKQVLSDNLGLIANVQMEEQTDSTGTMCMVVFETTKLGFKHSQVILDVFFAYLGAVRSAGVDMELYKSIQDMVKLRTVSNLAEVMTRLPREKLLSGDSLIEKPD